MKIICTIILLLQTSIFVFSQGRDKSLEVGSEYKYLISQLDSCIRDRVSNCTYITRNLISKGQSENVPYLDYLYFKTAFYYINRNELDSTKLYSGLAIINPHPIENKRSDADAYNLLANCYYHSGDYKTAIFYYLKVANIFEKTEPNVRLGYLYSNIALVFGEIGDDAQHLEYLFKSYDLLKQKNDDRYIGTIASNIGLAYYHQKDTAKAIEWSKRSLNIVENLDDLVAKIQSNMTLALVQKDINRAKEYIELSVKYADEYKDKTYMANSYYIYADVLNKLKEYERAKYYCEKAIELAEESGYSTILVNSKLTLAGIYYSLNKKSQAADYYKFYIANKDSILSIENNRAVNEINIKYETEKKEKQIISQQLEIQKGRSRLLYSILISFLIISLIIGVIIYVYRSYKNNLKQFEQEKQNAILVSFIEGEELERKRISYELHDGVAVMIGVAKMSLEALPHLDSVNAKIQLDKVKSILDSTHSDIRHLAHNLLPTVIEKEGLVSAVKQFVEEVNDAKLIQIKFSDQTNNPILLSKQMQLMLYRVIQELINNILKHSKAYNADIIFLDYYEGIKIEVIDDGVGLGDENKLWQQGILSIKQRLKSFGGNFEINSINGSGTKAEVYLKYI